MVYSNEEHGGTRAISPCMVGQRQHSRQTALPEQRHKDWVGIGKSLVYKERGTATEEQKISLEWRLGLATEANRVQASFRVKLETSESF